MNEGIEVKFKENALNPLEHAKTICTSIFFSTRVQAKHKMHFCAMLRDSRMREHYCESEASNFLKIFDAAALP